MFSKLFFITFFFHTFAHAFINVEPPIIGEKSALSGEFGIGAKYDKGNAEKNALNFTIKSQYDSKDWLIYLKASYNYGESNGMSDTNDGVIHLRYLHTFFNPQHDYELFFQSEFNEFQKIKNRELLGANIRRKLDLGFDKLYLGLGAFYSYMEEDSITIINPTYQQLNLNSYISFLKKLNSHFSITYVGYYQPNVENFSDFRTFQVLQFSNLISKNLSLSLDINHQYDAKPYVGVEKSDLRSSINLRYTFD